MIDTDFERQTERHISEAPKDVVSDAALEKLWSNGFEIHDFATLVDTLIEVERDRNVQYLGRVDAEKENDSLRHNLSAIAAIFEEQLIPGQQYTRDDCMLVLDKLHDLVVGFAIAPEPAAGERSAQELYDEVMRRAKSGEVASRGRKSSIVAAWALVDVAAEWGLEGGGGNAS